MQYFKKAKQVLKLFALATKKIVKFLFLALYNLFNKLPRAYTRVLAGALSFVILLGITSTVVSAAGVIPAYKVVVEKKKVATVKDKTVLAEAEILTADVLNNSECNSLVSEAKLVYCLTTENKLVDSKELSKRIVNNSSEITEYTVLSIGGIEVAGDKTEQQVNIVLDEYLSNYQKESGMEGVEYCETLCVNNKYIPTKKAQSLSSTENYAKECTLPVQSFKKVVVKETIKYGTEKTNTNELLVGSTKTVSAGVLGEKEVTYKVTYVNGEENGRTEISSVVTKKPVAKQVLVGTKEVASADKNGDVPMCWPVQRVARSYVSSYMGDGRGHKGMDIVAPKGTPIYAAYQGVVIFSGRDSSGYGNYIIIDHQNGYKTLYAHCSELYAKVGDTVAQGEHIAAVGSTGYSTGNHVHFEVRKGSSYLNPVKFIGSK